jgi:succinoglycan biosynthesis protein ExoA
VATTSPRSGAGTTRPELAYIMPVRNDATYLRTAVQSIFAQDNPEGTKIVLAVGPSTDATREVADQLASEFPITVLENPRGTTPPALNLAFNATDAEFVIRVDAHSELSDGYARRALDTLRSTGAANVGGVMVAKGTSLIQRAVAWAYGNRIGLGGGAFHVGGEPGPVDTVYLGCFRRDSLVEVGGFNEAMTRGQDWELNARLRESGHTVWFDPELRVGYYPRSTFRALAKQLVDTGMFRAFITLSSPGRVRLRYLAAPAVVAAAVGGAALALGVGHWWPLVPLAMYATAIVASVATATGVDIRTRLALLAVLPTMHFSWGLGFWKGVFVHRGHPAALAAARAARSGSAA